MILKSMFFAKYGLQMFVDVSLRKDGDKNRFPARCNTPHGGAKQPLRPLLSDAATTKTFAAGYIGGSCDPFRLPLKIAIFPDFRVMAKIKMLTY
ncbi:MAG: hypothetical protein HY886_00055 [Deltaproteobacteria bacterium]|nr:hypothetical protein [Deltaproteobacteria bacterium]